MGRRTVAASQHPDEGAAASDSRALHDHGGGARPDAACLRRGLVRSSSRRTLTGPTTCPTTIQHQSQGRAPVGRDRAPRRAGQATPANEQRVRRRSGRTYRPCHAVPYSSIVASVIATEGRTGSPAMPRASANLPRRLSARNANDQEPIPSTGVDHVDEAPVPAGRGRETPRLPGAARAGPRWAVRTSPSSERGQPRPLARVPSSSDPWLSVHDNAGQRAGEDGRDRGNACRGSRQHLTHPLRSRPESATRQVTRARGTRGARATGRSPAPMPRWRPTTGTDVSCSVASGETQSPISAHHRPGPPIISRPLGAATAVDTESSG